MPYFLPLWWNHKFPNAYGDATKRVPELALARDPIRLLVLNRQAQHRATFWSSMKKHPPQSGHFNCLGTPPYKRLISALNVTSTPQHSSLGTNGLHCADAYGNVQACNTATAHHTAEQEDDDNVAEQGRRRCSRNLLDQHPQRLDPNAIFLQP